MGLAVKKRDQRRKRKENKRIQWRLKDKSSRSTIAIDESMRNLFAQANRTRSRLHEILSSDDRMGLTAAEGEKLKFYLSKSKNPRKPTFDELDESSIRVLKHLEDLERQGQETTMESTMDSGEREEEDEGEGDEEGEGDQGDEAMGDDSGSDQAPEPIGPPSFTLPFRNQPSQADG